MSFEALAADFAAEAVEHVAHIERLVLALEAAGSAEAGAALTAELKRVLHTLKGNAGLVGARGLQSALHHLETVVAAPALTERALASLLTGIDVVRAEVVAIGQGRPVGETNPAVLALAAGVAPVAVEAEPQPEADIRVSRAQLDALVAAAGDLLVHDAALQRHSTTVAGGHALRDIADRLSASVRVVHEQVLRARAVPVGHLFARYHRLVRDEAKALGKDVTLVLEGESVEVDTAVLDLLSAALVHLVRNAVAHGIEAPSVRQARGKALTGRVTLSARRRGANVELWVADDGGGLDEAAVQNRAEALGLNPAQPAAALIFEAGFSTATLSNAAGRGVGLDVVRRSLHQLGGSVSVHSVRGHGARFELVVPASIAVQRAILCDVGGETYALPATSVIEANRLERSSVRWLGAGQAIEHRGRLVPLVGRAVLSSTASSDSGYAVVLQGDSLAALRVDALVGQQDLVFHPLDPSVRGDSPASGAALLADGRVVLRLDPQALIGGAIAEQVTS